MLKAIYNKAFKALYLPLEGALIKIFALLFLLLSAEVYADNYASSSLLKSLEKSWDSDYVSLACSDNIIRLHSAFSKVQQKDSSIIHIFHKYVPYVPITPLSQRLESNNRVFKPHNWSFHAVLYVSEKILDLDYTDNPKIEAFNVYFKNMWPQNDLYESYRFQIKPANLYSHFDTDGSMDQNLYPHMTFEELKRFIEQSNLSSL